MKKQIIVCLYTDLDLQVVLCKNALLTTVLGCCSFVLL